MSVFSFRKDEILNKKKLIDRLFAEGNSFFIYPFKVHYLFAPLETPFPVQVMIIVGKRSFSLAVDRNRVRRQIREVYRLNKHLLYHILSGQNKQCILALIYKPGVIITNEELEIKIKAAFKRLQKELDKNLNNPLLSLSDHNKT
jgi:ribonuclease P protein component